MKTRKLEQWLLLEQSGELTPKQVKKLHLELESSADARKLRDDLGVLCGAVRPIDEELPAWTVAKIAARLRQEEGPMPASFRLIKPLLAGTICLLAITGLLNFHEPSTSSTPAVATRAITGVDVWHDPFDEELNNLENLITSLSDHPFDLVEM